jgi:hypothetical protein
MAAPDLIHEVTHTGDAVHVQAIHRFSLGQHRVFTPAAFERWKSANADAVIENGDEPCDCTLAPGEVRESNDRVWFDATFGDTKQATVAVSSGAVKSEGPAPTQPKRGIPATQPEEVTPMATKSTKKATKGKADRSDAAKRAWVERRKRYGKTGISAKKQKSKSRRPAAKRK